MLVDGISTINSRRETTERMTDPIRRVLMITAHPDDCEFGAGGTVAKFVKEGKDVALVVVTNGDKGSSDRTMTSPRLAEIRAEEQRNASRTLGVDQVTFLGYPDGEVEDMQWQDPHVMVDISEVMDLKIKALACHASQFKDFAAVEKRVRQRGAELGKPAGYAYAEAFDRIVMA